MTAVCTDSKIHLASSENFLICFWVMFCCFHFNLCSVFWTKLYKMKPKKTSNPQSKWLLMRRQLFISRHLQQFWCLWLYFGCSSDRLRRVCWNGLPLLVPWLALWSSEWWLFPVLWSWTVSESCHSWCHCVLTWDCNKILLFGLSLWVDSRLLDLVSSKAGQN